MTALRIFAIARPSLIGAPVVGMSRQDREINRLARARLSPPRPHGRLNTLRSSRLAGAMEGGMADPRTGTSGVTKMESEISEAAKARALELATAHGSGSGNWAELSRFASGAALARFIQDVSDAAKEADDHLGQVARERLARFILPEPKPTPAKVLDQIIHDRFNWCNAGRVVVEDLAKRGLKVVEASDGE